MVENLENQSVNNDYEEILKKEEKNDVNEKLEDKGFFKYYLFIFLNSVIGFMLVLYLSRYLIESLAEKNIVDLKNVKMISSVVAATGLTVIFIMITLAFKKFFRKLFFSEIFLYIYIGGLTTLINIISWNFFFRIIGGFIANEQIAWKIAEVIAFVVSVFFAFFADKIVVFKSYNFNPKKVFAELGIFIGARVVTELINIAIMMFLIDYLKKEPIFGKVIASVVVIVLNYIFSKFIIFKKKINKE